VAKPSATTVAYSEGCRQTAPARSENFAKLPEFLLDLARGGVNNKLRLIPPPTPVAGFVPSQVCGILDSSNSGSLAMSSASPALFRRQDRSDAVILTFLAPRLLDEGKIRLAGDELLAAAGQVGDKTLVLGMEQVEYMSSHMVAKLLAVQQRLQGQGGKLVLADVQPRIYSTLRTANLDKVFDMRPLEDSRRRGWPVSDTDSDSGMTMPLE
jgi:anti-anti-sigma factor